ncbi:MAG: hypothetical protein LBG77_03315 [Dysgonamonadaceae bacterium]|jgi:cell division protein FtsW (lipid II flippase)|nr:hypothetical protein [Dysgonamonadaceae bacterium]
MSTDFIKALEISGIGLAGVFIFMAVFYFISTMIDKMFPPTEEDVA